MSTDENFERTPVKAIHDAYLDWTYARDAWRRGEASGVSAGDREQLHAELHTSVMIWYGRLHPYLTKVDSVEEYWKEKRLYRVGRKQELVFVCPKCERIRDPEVDERDFSEGDVCLDCGEGRLELREVPAIDSETGEAVYEWVCGLKSLEELQGQTVNVPQVTGTFRKRIETIEKPQRPNPSVLIRAGRLLDQAAIELNFLADVDTGAANPEDNLIDPGGRLDG